MEVSEIRGGEAGAVAVVLAEAFKDKLLALLGTVEGGEGVIEAILLEYQGHVLAARDGDKVVGAAIYRDRGWGPGRRTIDAVVRMLGVTGAFKANKRLTDVLQTTPKLDEGDALLDAIAVAPGSRRSGVGTSLLETGALWARERGTGRLCLSVKADNAGALAFYERNGFSETASYSNVMGGFRYMAKKL